MSRTWWECFFRDWTKLELIYDWTSDTYMPTLHDTSDDAWERYRLHRDNKKPYSKEEWHWEWGEDVILTNYYGWKTYHISQADKNKKLITWSKYVYDDTIKEISKAEAEKFLWYKLPEEKSHFDD